MRICQFRRRCSLPLVALAFAFVSLHGAGAEESEDLSFNYTRLDLDVGSSLRSEHVENWDGEGWIGTDYNRFWWKTLGETSAGSLESGDIQALYSQYIAQFWDLQGGYRHEFMPSRADQAVISLQGLAPYWFETDTELFLGGAGTVGGRIKLEYDLLWTQRLITRPELLVDWSVGSDRANKVGAGIRRAEFELQTRYEITRKIAPYVAIRYERELGETADLVRSEGKQPEAVVLSAGIRLIF